MDVYPNTPADKPAKPPPLTEPVEIAKFWKNRRRDTAIVVSLRHYEGHNLVDVREYFTDQAGCMKPSTRGLAMTVRRLPELCAAICAADQKARELNLLPEEGAE